MPVLVRTQDDVGLAELTEAGATEVVPETLEASLMLVLQVLLLLKLPASKVMRTVSDIRANRYATLRDVFRHDGAQVVDDTHAFRDELRSIVLATRCLGGGAAARGGADAGRQRDLHRGASPRHNRSSAGRGHRAARG